MRPLEHMDISELIPLTGDDATSPPELLSTMRELVWRKCQTDLDFFLRNFWHIEVVGKGYTRFLPRDYQASEIKVMAEAMKRDRVREIRLKARQIGFTTLAGGMAFHSAFFNAHRSWMIASQGQTEAQDTLTLKIKGGFDRLPKWMQSRGPMKLDDSKERVTFDNGSTIMSVTSTSSSGRSKSVFGVILDELAFVEDGDGLISAIDPLCYGPLFIFSTANGIGNTFHQTWIESRRSDSEWNDLSREMRPKEKWNGTFHPWSAVETRTADWYEREKRKYRGKEHLFYQEYPSTPEEAFIKSGRTALPIDILEETQCWCEPTWRVDLSKVNFNVFDQIPHDALIEEGSVEEPNELWIWALPTVERDKRSNHAVRPPSYVVATDTAEGLEDGDRTSIAVIDTNNSEVVATYRGAWPIESLGILIEWLGYFYHTALQVPERNNMGLVPIVYLQDQRYPRIIRMDQPGQKRPGRRSERLGWATTPTSKPRMVYSLVEAIRNGTILLHDRRFLEEAMTFVIDAKGAFGATKGNHDDHVLSHLLAVMGAEDVGSYPIVWRDPEDLSVTFAMLEQVANRNRSAPYDREPPIGQRPAVDSGVVHSFFA